MSLASYRLLHPASLGGHYIGGLPLVEQENTEIFQFEFVAANDVNSM